MPLQYKFNVWQAIEAAYKDKVADLNEVEIIVGDATGVDDFARQYINSGFMLKPKIRVRLSVYVANWNAQGRAAGPIRNQKMVDQKPDVCLAFYYGVVSPGTKSCVERAKKAGIPVQEFTIG